MISISAELSDEQLNDYFQLLSPQQMIDAERAAVNKAARWANTQLKRGIAKRSKIAQKFLKSRIRLSLADRGNHRIIKAFIWIGGNDFNAYYAGKPQQTATGVKVGKHSFDSRFLIAGRDAIYHRTGKSRYPIKRQIIDISEANEETVLEVKAQLPARMKLELIRQIEWRLSK